MPYSHDDCKHPKTKVARAACRREREGARSTNKATRPGPRLPSVIAEKVRPVIDAAKAKGLTIKLSNDAPDGVAQMFIIHPKGKPNCQLIAEAFQAASKGREGKAQFFHVEDGKSRQLSRQRALADVDTLANA